MSSLRDRDPYPFGETGSHDVEGLHRRYAGNPTFAALVDMFLGLMAQHPETDAHELLVHAVGMGEDRMACGCAARVKESTPEQLREAAALSLKEWRLSKGRR